MQWAAIRCGDDLTGEDRFQQISVFDIHQPDAETGREIFCSRGCQFAPAMTAGSSSYCFEPKIMERYLSPASAPVWTYVELVQRSLPLTMAAAGETAMLTVAASIAGAAALRQGKWRLQRPTLADILKSFVGGALMDVGVALIPSGNNGLILAAIPAFSLLAELPYILLMTATIVLGLSVRGRISRKRTMA